MANITKLHNNTFQVQIRTKTTRHFKTFKTLPEAEAYLEAYQAPSSDLIAKASTVTVGTLIARYATEVTPLKKSSSVEACRLSKMLANPIALIEISELKASDLSSYRDSRLKKVSSGTALRELSILTHILTVAKRDWSYPLKLEDLKIRKPKAGSARTRRLKKGEYELLLSKAPRKLATLLELLVETACRLGELASLQWSEVDLQERVLRLKDAKAGARDVPLSSRAISILEAMPRHTFKVFEWKSTSSIQSAWYRLVKPLGLQDLRIHDLRREAISRRAEQGFTISELQVISGHKTLNMLQVYTKLSASKLAEKL